MKNKKITICYVSERSQYLKVHFEYETAREVILEVTGTEKYDIFSRRILK